MKSISRALSARFGNLTPKGRCYMWLGLLTLGVSMGMAYDYGSQVSWKHGAVMAALSVATAFVLEDAYGYWKKGLHAVAIIFAIVSAPLFWQESKSHIAYTAGFRGASVDVVRVQNAKYDGAQDKVQENKKNLADMKAELATMKSANGWSATVTADGLRAQVAAMEGDKVFKRAKECRDVTIPESRAFCDKRADLQDKIAAAERLTSLQNKIQNLQVAVDTYRDDAGKVEHKTSVVEHQTTTLVKVASLLTRGDFNASPILAESVDLENTVFLALMPVILPAFFFFVMGLERKGDHDPEFTFAKRSATPIATPHVLTETKVVEREKVVPVVPDHSRIIAELMKQQRRAA